MIEFERGRVTQPYHDPYFQNVKPGIIDRLVRLAAAINANVDMGYHLCYGDLGSVPFAKPEDAAVLVDLANSIEQKISPIHAIKYIHMPVPKDRIDASYFEPLKNLKLNDTKLYLGLIYPDDEEGTKERIEAAKKVCPVSFGVASACGMGRLTKEGAKSILKIAKAIT